ncbi:MAG: ribosome biogenesis GTP-binding protein YihA/YsxC [Bacteroidia bacterium]|nr:ribosome biogenesis GTP-binding protein YihA/YsxC [Bacteroidia bacterium]
MHVKKAEFVISTTDFNKLPQPTLPEYAFIGRSNVGKSSLINMIVGNSHLAHTSRQPGKTQTMVVFKVNDSWYLTDLPGYGYAKASVAQREQWQKMITHYIIHRQNLMSLFVLVDVRLSPQKIDIEFINRLGQWQIPFSIAFTKADKVSRNTVHNNVKFFLDTISEYWEELPKYFVTSAQTKVGRQELLSWIEAQNKMFKASMK